jgi:tetratricopeptide (TPR) repeat protein
VIFNKAPDWKKLAENINTKYKYNRTDSLIMASQLRFFNDMKDDLAAAKARTAFVEKYPPAAVGMNVFFSLNSPAWSTFQTSDDPKILEEALKWSALSMKLEESDQYMDTYANILYKLGRTDEAIAMETKALELGIAMARKNNTPFKKEGAFTDCLDVLHKMVNGKPTWPTQGK